MNHEISQISTREVFVLQRRINLSVIISCNLVVGICLLNGCVYYNTFYNAKRAYADAMKEKRRSPSETVNPTVKSLLEAAIQKCEKIVTYHPKSKWVDDAIFLMGKCFYEMEDYENALRKFDELEIYYPESPFFEEVIFLRGRTYLQQKNYTAAISAFEGLNRISKKFGDASQYEILEAYYKKGGYEEVVRMGRAFLEIFPKSSYRQDAHFKLANALFELARFEEALQEFQDLLQEDPPKELAFDVTLMIGESYLALDPPQADMALETFLALKTSHLTPQEEALLNLKIASCQRLLKEFLGGIRTLKKVPEIHPRSKEAAEAYYTMGLIYQEDLMSPEKARESFDKVRETNPQTEVAKDALLRSTTIGKLAEYRKKLSSGEEEALAETQFLLAELYLLELKKTDEALDAYERVIQDFPESEFGPRASYAIAWVFHYLEEDTVKAMEAYERIIESYPETRFATASQKAIQQLNGNNE